MPDLLEDALRQLPPPRMSVQRREQIRARAQSTLRRRPCQPRSQVYRRVFEPALVATVCVLQLVWLFTTTAALLTP